MKIFVKAHPKAKKARVVKKDETHYEVWVHEAPEDGKANRAVIEALSQEIGVTKSKFSVVAGQTGRNKVVELR
jgi:hypothetical protein